MAKARTTTTHVEKKVTRVEKVPVKTIHLELTEGDADFLIAVLGLIGGNTKDSPRKYGQRILKALEEATGIRGRYVQSTDAGKLVKDNGGSGRAAIYFNDYPDPDAGRNAAQEPPAEQDGRVGQLLMAEPFQFHMGGFADFPPPAVDHRYRPGRVTW